MTDFLLYLWDYAIIIPAAFMCVFPVIDHSRIKKRMLIPLMSAGLVVLSVIMAFFRYYFGLPADLPLFIILLPIAVLYLINFDIKKMKLLYILISVMAGLSFAGVSTYYTEAVTDSPNSQYIAYGIKWLISMIFFLLEFIFMKKIRSLIENEEITQIWTYVWTMPAVLILTNFFLIPANYSNVRIGKIFFLYVLVECVLMIFFIMFTFILSNIAQVVTRESKAVQNARLLELQAAQYTNMKNYLDSSSRLRHDFRYMAKTAQALAASGEIDKLKELLSEYGAELDSLSAPAKYCKNTILNAVVGYYAEDAKNKKISFEARINAPKNLGFSERDICSITGNILDNAISAALESSNKEKSILFIIDTKQNGDLYMLLSNSYGGKIRKEKGHYLTTKPNGHGIGLKSVRAIVEKNGGYCNFRYDRERFYSEIMLKNING